jgi:hypothetical protein
VDKVTVEIYSPTPPSAGHPLREHLEDLFEFLPSEISIGMGPAHQIPEILLSHAGPLRVLIR